MEPSDDAPVDSVVATVKWLPPTSGTPVAYYVMDWAHGQVDTVARNKVRVVVPKRRTRVRVAGVDSLARQGPWSPWSKWWPLRPQEDLHADDGDPNP